ncbi:hypothetical protein JOB18_007601 [Solea senegalensis]|nr:hypothetical protein JOB18_007601 [Solea senegalensis]
MADVSLRAELQLKDGQRQKISVQLQNTLCSLVCGINELNVNVSQLLTQLVDREKDTRHCEEGDEEEDSDEEESLCQRPPVKRLKP